MTKASTFSPPWWLPEAHTQTLWRRVSPKPSLPERQRQRIELRDGDFIDVDWSAPLGTAADNKELFSWLPIVLIMHGLCGCSSSPYVLALQQVLSRRGYHSAAINFRSCSGEPNRLARAYHSGGSDDLEEVYCALQKTLPGRNSVLVGYSLGANVLLKWLAEYPRPEQVLGGVAVSTPFSLSLCSRSMNSGISSAYGRYFLRRLLFDVRRKQKLFRQQNKLEELEKLDALGNLDNLATLWDFDDRVTAPLHGFRNAEDYYERCSSQSFVGAIQSSTLLIHSRNDPIIPVTAVPAMQNLADNTQLELLSAGGHVGFNAAGNSRWLEQRILGFIEQRQPIS